MAERSIPDMTISTLLAEAQEPTAPSEGRGEAEVQQLAEDGCADLLWEGYHSDDDDD